MKSNVRARAGRAILRPSKIGVFGFISIGFFAVGVVLLFGSVPSPIGWVNWPTSFVGPGAALMGVGFTTLIAQLGLETVLDKRRATLEASTRQNKSRVYEEVFGHVIESFGAPSHTLSEHAVRARAATWASAETIGALTEWFRYAARHSGTNTSDPLKLAERYELVYRVGRSMRRDLELDTPEVSKDHLDGMIFEDYSPEVHDSREVRSLKVDANGDAVLPSGAGVPELGCKVSTAPLAERSSATHGRPPKDAS